MRKNFRLTGWRCAWGIAWLFVLCLLGLTVAEISQYGGVVQFYGTSLTFTWEVDQPAHHYRIFLTTSRPGAAPSDDIETVHYAQNPLFEVETEAGRAYRMRVQALSAAGDTSEASNSSPLYLCLGSTAEDAAEDFAAALPGRTTLGPGYPNPFNASTSIPFSIASQSGVPVNVSLRIYNTLGRVVRELVNEERPPGQYHEVWDGRNAQGMYVSAGTYICLLQAGNYSGTRTLTYMK